jgi:hypothetical protein
VRFAGHRGAQIPYFGGVGIDQHQVLVRVRFLLAAGVLLLLHGIGRTLAPAFRAVDDPIGSALEGQGAGGDPMRIAFRRHAQRGEGLCQDREQAMHPIGALRLAQSKLQPVHCLQGVGLLVDQNEESFVFHLREDTFGAAPPLALACLAFPGLLGRITSGIGHSKGREHLGELLVCQARRGQELSWFVL